MLGKTEQYTPQAQKTIQPYRYFRPPLHIADLGPRNINSPASVPFSLSSWRYTTK